MHPVPPRSSRLAVRLGGLLVLALALWGCETIAITALGIGASAGVTHSVNGTSARTFTAPEAKVKAASLAALGRMGAAVDAIDRVENGELIRARSADRSIEVEIEPMSRTTTHVRASAKRSFFVYDGATATEIIVQTELALLPAAPGAAPAKRGGKVLTSVPATQQRRARPARVPCRARRPARRTVLYPRRPPKQGAPSRSNGSTPFPSTGCGGRTARTSRSSSTSTATGASSRIEEAAGAEARSWAERHGAAREGGSEAEAVPALEPAFDALAGSIARGFVLIVDYGHPSEELYGPRHRRGTVLAYRRHRAHEDLLDHPGEQDLTAQVNFTALDLRARATGLLPLGLTTQDRFLLSTGILEAFDGTDDPAWGDPDRVKRRLQAKQLIHPHAMGRPYYINLAADDPEKLAASRERILSACRMAALMRARNVVFHAGFYQGRSAAKTFARIAQAIERLLMAVQKQRWAVVLCPETTGKPAQFGSLDECLQLAQETGCGFTNFSHLLARADGNIDYGEVIERLPPRFHAHFSGIEYGPKGDRRHLKTTPKFFRPLAEALARRSVDVTLINESPQSAQTTMFVPNRRASSCLAGVSP